MHRVLTVLPSCSHRSPATFLPRLFRPPSCKLPPNGSATGAGKDVCHIRILGLGWRGWCYVRVTWQTFVFSQVTIRESATDVENGVHYENKERGMGYGMVDGVGFEERKRSRKDFLWCSTLFNFNDNLVFTCYILALLCRPI